MQLTDPGISGSKEAGNSGHRYNQESHWKCPFTGQRSRKHYCLLQLEIDSGIAVLLRYEEGVTGSHKINKTLPQISVRTSSSLDSTTQEYNL